MSFIFALLFFAAFGCLIVGLIRPSVFSAYFKGGATRGKLFFIFGGTMFLSMLFVGSLSSSRQVEGKVGNISVNPRAESKATITKAEFDQIQMGMTYEQVRDTIGGEGDLLSEVEVSGTRSVVYMWKGNSFGGNANFTFTDGVLQARAQFGLR